jgi:hypothetical protein|tara:strand:- start:593 stop:760 length:168 start_codon:yes stop_codon:yes gene_type:complete
MSCEHNTKLLELYFDQAKRHGLSDIDAETYANMRLENEGEELSEAQMRQLMGAED